MPDTPTVTPLDKLRAADAAANELVPASVMRKDTQERWNAVFAGIEAGIAALRPVEADDAGLIERVAALDPNRYVDGIRSPAWREACLSIAPHAYKLRDRLASLSAAKVEAEKEVERLRGDLREALDMVREAAQTSNYSVSAFAALKGRAQGDG